MYLQFSANFAQPLAIVLYAYTATLSCGLGIPRAYGGNMSWPQDTGFRSVAISLLV